MTSFSDIMKGIIFKKGRGNFITPEDFGNQVSSASLRTELVNFNNSHFLIHIARGLYYFPHIGADRKAIKPTYMDIIKFVEETTKTTVYPSPEAARYLVGLDTDYMPTMDLFTTGATKKINLVTGPEMSFKKVRKSDKYPELSSLKLRTLVIAVCSYGNKKINKDQIEIMNRFCSTMVFEEIVQDIEGLPIWMKNNLKFPSSQNE